MNRTIYILREDHTGQWALEAWKNSALEKIIPISRIQADILSKTFEEEIKNY